MQPLNYSRQAIKFLKPRIEKQPAGVQRQFIAETVAHLERGVKFMLPLRGVLLEDWHFRGLGDGDLGNMPFPETILEYNAGEPTQEELARGGVRCTRRIVVVLDRGHDLVVLPVNNVDALGYWAPQPPVVIIKNRWVNRAMVNESGEPAVLMSRMADDRFPVLPDSDYQSEVVVVVSFLNALACSNVRPLLLPSARRKEKTRRGGIPFDEYRVLAISVGGAPRAPEATQIGDRRSPREHLRRGHIRNLSDGRRIWVQAAMVSVGAAGKVHKDYRMSA